MYPLTSVHLSRNRAGSPRSDVHLNSYFWKNDIIVEIHEDFWVLGMHRNQYFRLHSLDHLPVIRRF